MPRPNDTRPPPCGEARPTTYSDAIRFKGKENDASLGCYPDNSHTNGLGFSRIEAEMD